MRTRDWKTVPMQTACLLVLLSLLLTTLAGCGTRGEQASEARIDRAPAERSGVSDELHYDHSLDLGYATRYAVDFYREGGSLVTVADDRQYFLKEKDVSVPKDLKDGVTVIEVPLKNAYLSGSGSMDYFVACEGLGSLAYSSQQESGWHIPEAAEAMHRGDLVYAG